MGAEPPGGLAEYELKLSLSKGRRIIAICYDEGDFEPVS